MREWRSLAAAFALVIGGAPALHGQVVTRDSTGTINGAVVSAVNGEPLPRAQITIGGTVRGTIADDLGRFTITGLAAGTVTLRTRALGYRIISRDVIVRAGERAEVIITMDPLPQTLNPVQTI